MGWKIFSRHEDRDVGRMSGGVQIRLGPDIHFFLAPRGERAARVAVVRSSPLAQGKGDAHEHNARQNQKPNEQSQRQRSDESCDVHIRHMRVGHTR